MPTRDVLTRLAAANPVPEESLADGVDRALYERIVAHSRPARPVLSRRRILAGSAVLAGACAGVGVVLLRSDRRTTPSPAGYVLSPPMLNLQPDGRPAAEVLADLADRAAKQPSPSAGRYWYTKAQWIGLNTAAAAGAHPSSTSALRSELTERWIAADGSGRIVQTLGDIVVQHEGSEETVKAVTFHGPPVSDQRTKPGEQGTWAPLSAWPTDPARLRTQLDADHTVYASGNPDDQLRTVYRRAETVLAIVKQQPVPAPMWAAMLRVLAEIPGLVSQGTVTDRLNRRAVAVGFDLTRAAYTDGSAAVMPYVRSQRVVLLFDPLTGGYLGEDWIYTTKLGDGPYDKYLNIRVPCVKESYALVTAASMPVDSQRP